MRLHYDPSGRIDTETSDDQPEREGLNSVLGSYPPGGTIENCWVDPATGEVALRPLTGLPGAHSLPVDTDWHLPGVPDGTAVTIEGVAAGTVEGGDGLVLSFPTAGDWQVALSPPWPWRPAACVVEVTA